MNSDSVNENLGSIRIYYTAVVSNNIDLSTNQI